jgi:hypothetical protein
MHSKQVDHHHERNPAYLAGPDTRLQGLGLKEKASAEGACPSGAAPIQPSSRCRIPASTVHREPPLGQQQNVITSDIAARTAEGGFPVPIENWTPSEGTIQGQGWASLNSSTIESGQEDSGIQEGSTLKDQEEPNSESTKRRSTSRLIRAYYKVTYELTQMSAPAKPKKEEEEKKVFKAFITVEDEVGTKHLQYRISRREEFQTTLQNSGKA